MEVQTDAIRGSSEELLDAAEDIRGMSLAIEGGTR